MFECKIWAHRSSEGWALSRVMVDDYGSREDIWYKCLS